MKTKRTFISIFTLCVALLLTACNGNGTSDTENSQNTQTESSTDSSDDSNTKLDDLYQQENQLFADHKDVWDKAFGIIPWSAPPHPENNETTLYITLHLPYNYLINCILSKIYSIG